MALTFHQDLGHLGVAGAEGAVQLETVGVVQEGAPQREQHFLDLTKKGLAGSCHAHLAVGPPKPQPDQPASASVPLAQPSPLSRLVA